LNYRYQLRRADARVAIAPRLSMLVRRETPRAGSEASCRRAAECAGERDPHAGAGESLERRLTLVPQATTYNLGASVIWLARPTFNVMVEATWVDQVGRTTSS